MRSFSKPKDITKSTIEKRNAEEDELKKYDGIINKLAQAIIHKDKQTNQIENDYSKENYNLLIPSSVKIINISYTDMGYDSNFDKQRIQFKVYAHSSKNLDKKELDSIGDRINYNLRKSIALTFETTQATNKLFNPVFSEHYIFTTANVKWV